MPTPREAAAAARSFLKTGSPTWDELTQLVSQTRFAPDASPQVHGTDMTYSYDTWGDTMGLVGLSFQQQMELLRVAK